MPPRGLARLGERLQVFGGERHDPRDPRQQPVQIAGAVVLDPVAQGQILRAGRRTQWVGLHETAKPLDGGQQGGGREQAARHRMAA